MSRYLTEFTQDEIRLSREFWKDYASRKALVDGTDDYSIEGLQYYQTTRRGRLRYRRRVPYTSIKMDVIRFANGVRKEQRKLAGKLVAGNITGQEWYDETLFLAKLTHYSAFIVEEGGLLLDQQERIDRWLIVVVPIFLSLNRVAVNLSTGRRELNGRLLLDGDMFSENIIGSFENWRLNWAIGHNVRQARRRLQPSESNCHDSNDRKGCIELALRGWMNTWAMVPIGMAACFHKCRCYLEYRDELE